MSAVAGASPETRASTTTAGKTSKRRGSKRGPTRRKQTFAAWALVTPFLLVFVAMLLVPLIYSGYLSTFRTRLIGGTSFIGLSNYVQAIQDPLFLHALLRMLLFLFIQVPIMLGAALFFALVLDSGRIRLAKFVRLSIFIPYAIPGVVATLMWGYLYGRDHGLISQVLRDIGFSSPPNLLSSGLIVPSIMNIVTWEFVGYNMIVLFAALRAVPAELYDAARVDGAGDVRIARRVKIPSIRPAILLTVIFSVIGSFQLFSEPQLLYTLSSNAVGTAFSPNLYAYNLAFVNQNINYAAAIAFLLGIGIMIVSYAVQLTANRGYRGLA